MVLSVFWVLVGVGGYFLGMVGGGGIFWVVVGVGGYFFVVVGGSGYFLGGGRWSWMVVGGGTVYNSPTKCFSFKT